MGQSHLFGDLPYTTMSFDEPKSEEIAESSEPTPPSGQSTLISQMTSGDQLLRSNAIVALGTGLSRLTGMLRVIVFGVVIGQTALADAYDGANNSPNAVYELLLGGVLSAALVPMFTRMLEDDDRDSAEAVVGTAIVALTFITAIAVFLHRGFSERFLSIPQTELMPINSAPSVLL